MSVDGVAWATVISNAVSSVALIYCLSRANDDCHFDFKKLRMDRRSLRDIIRIGFPAGIQSALFSFSNIMIQSYILRMNDILAPGSIYEPVVDGNAAVSNLNGFIYTATNSVCQASVAFTSQNVGAGRYDRVKRVMLSSYAITTAVALIFSFFIMVFNHQLLALYGIVDGEGLDAIAYSTAMIKMKCETLPYFILAWMEVICGVLRGLGKSMTSTVVSLIGACLLRVVWLLTIFEYFLTLESIYISYPVSWILTAAISFVLVVVELRRHRAPMVLAA
jgi:Na+-driven multidrug efflux pump